ncbi:uncharacterized protein [Medicago truncatula]|uniref:TRF2/HOY1 PH-like domain-containing protein n=1 Tax=Medicago truncatula TaxID=3880 RepID=Q2HWB5_MEDTR|nr:uncharacterized protein LOC11408817 [Medicago truncatula]ABD32499.1 hypothetical protein MtrDRAFT_AC147482g16v2 [Medicago truncatula]AES74800.2 hypothetical protein MTR_6g013260 [Medicago truncatula]
MDLLPPIGLKFPKSVIQEIIDELEFKKRQRETPLQRTTLTANKTITHVCFLATLLKIGRFEFMPRNEVNLVAHCYFEHQKFLWGMLDKSTNIKYKIEIMWQDISAIRIVDEDKKPGILEIELIKVPTFYHHINSMWESSQDFTDGHAAICRRHYLEFPPKVNFKKLLQSNKHLLELSQRPFPSLDSSFFGIPLITPPSLIYSTPPVSVNNHFHNPCPNFLSAPNTC